MSEQRDVTALPLHDREWEDVAKQHAEKQEWVSARLAADVADALRFYRLHDEARDSEGWQP